MSITIIDYGSGNLKSAAKALELAANNINANSKIVVTSDPKIIKQSDKIVLPGQGSFRDCYLGIKKISGLDETLNEFVLERKKPILGICVGMQLFANFGDEDGGSDGLGWIEGKVKKISLKDLSLKLPHMGWNNIQILSNSKLLSGVNNDSHFYFVHSYSYEVDEKKYVSATTNYSIEIVSAIEKDNIFGTQFHPEKSQQAGMQVIKNFIELK